MDTTETTYEAPAITDIASVHELTLTAKDDVNKPDGFTYHGITLTS